MEQLIESSFFLYAVKNKTFLDSFESFSLKFPKQIQSLNFYLDNNFIECYSRVFLLIRIHEQFLSDHSELLSKKDLHIKSLFCKLFETQMFHFNLKYAVKQKEDIIILLHISMILSIDNQLQEIINRNNLSKSIYQDDKSLINQYLLIDNFNLLTLSPYIFNSSELKEILNNDISLINKDLPEHEFYEDGTDVAIVLNTIESIYSEIRIRTKSEHIRKYYLYGYHKFTDHSLNSKRINNLIFNSSFLIKIPKSFDEIFLKPINLAELRVTLNIDINKNISSKSEEKKNSLFMHSQIIKSSIHSKIKINCTFKLADSLFKKYFELSLSDSRFKTIYPRFRCFLEELFNITAIQKDMKNVDLEELEVKNLIGFFQEYKSTSITKNLFSYKVTNLITFLEHITGLQAKISTWDKAHRQQKFRLNKDWKKQINSIIDKYPEGRKW